MRVPILCVLLAACGPDAKDHKLDPSVIRVTTDAKMRTDVVGEGRFAETATFVLVDAENTASEGAYVTLMGSLGNAAGQKVGELKQQSLYIPAHESRTYALVDLERKARPDAVAAQVEVKSVMVMGFAPTAKLTNVKTLVDGEGPTAKVVLQATVENPTEWLGRIVVIGSFHDKAGTPMTRPFDLLTMEPHTKRGIQFVGPPGSVRGQLYIGDESY